MALRQVSQIEHFRWWFRRNGWWLFLLGILLGVGMSFWGYWVAQNYYFDTNNKLRWGDVIYYTLQMIPLYGFGPVNPDIPWQLNFARFWLPTVFFFTAVMSLIHLVGRNGLGVSRYFLQHHVIICGNGPQAVELVRQYRTRNLPQAVLLITPLPDFKDCEEVRALGASILVDDMTASNCWRNAAFSKAKAIYLLAADDVNNLRAFETLCSVAQGSKSGVTKMASPCLIHLSDSSLRRWVIQALESSEFHRSRSLRWIFFNTVEYCARDLFLSYGPHIDWRPDRNEARPAMLILGFNSLAEQLILQAAKLGYYPNAKKLEVTLVASNAKEAEESLNARFPAIASDSTERWLEVERPLIPLINLRYVVAQPDAPPSDIFYTLTNKDEERYQVCFICVDNAATAVKAVEMLRAQCSDPANRRPTFRIVLCLPNGENMLERLTRDGEWFGTRRIETDNLTVFDPVAHGCHIDSQETIARERSERDAMNLHRFYVQGDDFDWQMLPEDERDSNRQAADHLQIKEKFLDCSDDELMRTEHARWCAERLLGGWRYSPEKSTTARLNPNLRPYDEISIADQKKNLPIVSYAREIAIQRRVRFEVH